MMTVVSKFFGINYRFTMVRHIDRRATLSLEFGHGETGHYRSTIARSETSQFARIITTP
jgi:hypothetical protein